MRRRPDRRQHVELVDVHESVVVGPTPPGEGPTTDAATAEAAGRPRRRWRWWPVAVPVVLVLALVAAQSVLDAREQDRLERLGAVPGVLLPLDDSMHALWTSEQEGDLQGAAVPGDGTIVVGAVLPSGAQVVRGVDIRTGTVRWEVEVAVAETGVEGETWPPYCTTTSTPGLLMCLVYDTIIETTTDTGETYLGPTRRDVVMVDSHELAVTARITTRPEDSAAVVDDQVVVASYADETVTVTAHDPRTLAELWRFEAHAEPDDTTGLPDRAWVQADGPTRLTVSGPHSTWSLTSDGTLLGTVEEGEPFGGMNPAWQVRATTTVYQQPDTYQYAVRRADGTFGESFDDEVVTLTVDDGSVPDLFFTTGFGEVGSALLARSTATGEVSWEAPGVSAGSQAVLLEDTLYVAALRTVTALDATTGTVRWTHELDGSTTDDALFTDGRVVIVIDSTYSDGASAGTLVALSTADGSQQWTVPVTAGDYFRVIAGHLVSTAWDSESVSDGNPWSLTTVYGVDSPPSGTSDAVAAGGPLLARAGSSVVAMG